MSWKVLDAWFKTMPPKQAPALPLEVIQAAAVVLLLVGQPEIGSLLVVCYAALLRCSEGLKLTYRGVIIGSSTVTLLLGVTKRGQEQKVVISHPTVVHWLLSYFKRTLKRKAADPDGRVFPVSYPIVLAWLRTVMAALGFGDWAVTTHSMRRSGATELSRQGMPMADLCELGRWLSMLSAREYIRKGEVAILRSRAEYRGQLNMCLQWASLCSLVWDMLDTGACAIVERRFVNARLFRIFGSSATDSSGRLARRPALGSVRRP